MTTRLSSHPHPHWAPESRAGRWAVALAAASVGAVAIQVLAFVLGVVEPADSYTDSWGQAVWGAGIWASALAAVVTGVVATVRAHDRSRLVPVAVALGLLPAVLLLSEIALGEF